MDIFLSPGDSPLTITAGDTTLHIRVWPNMDTSPQPPTPAPAPALPVMRDITTARQSIRATRPLWRRPAIIGLGVLVMLCAGLYSHMSNSPASSPAPHSPHLALLAPPEFPSEQVIRPPTRPLPESSAPPAQPAPLLLNQAFGLH